jgi:hypothetical protein
MPTVGTDPLEDEPLELELLPVLLVEWEPLELLDEMTPFDPLELFDAWELPEELLEEISPLELLDDWLPLVLPPLLLLFPELLPLLLPEPLPLLLGVVSGQLASSSQPCSASAPAGPCSWLHGSSSTQLK